MQSDSLSPRRVLLVRTLQMLVQSKRNLILRCNYSIAGTQDLSCAVNKTQSSSSLQTVLLPPFLHNEQSKCYWVKGTSLVLMVPPCTWYMNTQSRRGRIKLFRVFQPCRRVWMNRKYAKSTNWITSILLQHVALHHQLQQLWAIFLSADLQV